MFIVGVLVFFVASCLSPPQCSNWSFNQRFCFVFVFVLFFLVLIIKTNCIFLEEERVCVFIASAWLPGTVSLAVAASSQKPASLALLSSTPATSECCHLGGKKKPVHDPKGARTELNDNGAVSTRWCLKVFGLRTDV